MNQRRYVVIAGPTASGKSEVALALADEIGGEIVSCDSVQVYRGFDLGSAKPTAGERAKVAHHLIDIVDWHEDYDAGRYAKDARLAIESIAARGVVPIVVGGSGLYLRALWGSAFHSQLPKDEALRASLAQEDLEILYRRLQKLDPQRATEIHANDRFRVVRALELLTLLGRPLRELQSDLARDHSDESYVIVMHPPRNVLHQRIAARTSTMLKSGLLGEVEGLLGAGCPATARPMESIGYKQCCAFLAGTLPAKDVEPKILAATRQYAKRQTTWFRDVRVDERFVERVQSHGLADRVRKAVVAHLK